MPGRCRSYDVHAFLVSGRKHNAVSSCRFHRGDLIRSHEGIRQVFEEVIVVERCSEGCSYSRGTMGSKVRGRHI